MKNYIYMLFLLLATPFVAQNTTEIANIKASVRKHYEDIAFKMNAKFSLLEISDLSYQHVGDNALDTLRLVKSQQNFAKYLQLAKLHREKSQNEKDLMDISKSVDNETVASMYERDYLNSAQMAGLYLDTAKMFLTLDSIIRQRMENRNLSNTDDPQKYFKVEYQLKATLSGQNILDRYVLYLTRKYKVVTIN